MSGDDGVVLKGHLARPVCCISLLIMDIGALIWGRCKRVDLSPCVPDQLESGVTFSYVWIKGKSLIVSLRTSGAQVVLN